jgi:mRNA interferase RelE/StbE
VYEVNFTPEAEDDLARLTKPITQQIFIKVRWLAENFELVTPEPLTGQWQGFFKLRVGDYRVVYTFSQAEQHIIVHLVKHRREVYKMK